MSYCYDYKTPSGIVLQMQYEQRPEPLENLFLEHPFVLVDTVFFCGLNSHNLVQQMADHSDVRALPLVDVAHTLKNLEHSLPSFTQPNVHVLPSTLEHLRHIREQLGESLRFYNDHIKTKIRYHHHVDEGTYEKLSLLDMYGNTFNTLVQKLAHHQYHPPALTLHTFLDFFTHLSEPGRDKTANKRFFFRERRQYDPSHFYHLLGSALSAILYEGPKFEQNGAIAVFAKQSEFLFFLQMGLEHLLTSKDPVLTHDFSEQSLEKLTLLMPFKEFFHEITFSCHYSPYPKDMLRKKPEEAFFTHLDL